MDTINPTGHLADAAAHLSAAASQYDTSDLGALDDALRNITRARALIEVAEDCTVQDMRHRRATWTEIGTALGVSRSAAQQRFRHIEP